MPPIAPSPADDPEGPAGTGGSGAFAFTVMTRRADFLRTASARRQGTPGFLLQARQRRPDEAGAGAGVRIGYTCSKKLGNAVVRNRAKRRLRAVARQVLGQGVAQPGWDYVLVGRPGATVSRAFADLAEDLGTALARIHGGGA